MNTVKFNQKCAEFLGKETKVYSDTPTLIYYNFDNRMLRAEEMKFHSDWNWIMEVVEKIKSIDDNQEDWFDDYYRISFHIDLIHGVEFKIDNERLFLMTAFGEGQLLDAVVEAVNCFLEWFEQKVKKND